VPCPVRDVGDRRDALRRREVLARHGLLDVPLLDVDDRPHGDARALRQAPGLAIDDRGVVEAFVWESHGQLLFYMLASHGGAPAPRRPRLGSFVCFARWGPSPTTSSARTAGGSG